MSFHSSHTLHDSNHPAERNLPDAADAAIDAAASLNTEGSHTTIAAPLAARGGVGTADGVLDLARQLFSLLVCHSLQTCLLHCLLEAAEAAATKPRAAADAAAPAAALSPTHPAAVPAAARRPGSANRPDSEVAVSPAMASRSHAADPGHIGRLCGGEQHPYQGRVGRQRVSGVLVEANKQINPSGIAPLEHPERQTRQGC